MSNKLFNTSFELSLHVVLLLDIANTAITLDRIIAYDFMAVYSGTFHVSNSSLNGENRFAFSEISARRKLIKSAVKDLVLDRLVLVEDTESGILYCISELGRKMSRGFKSEYARQYKEIMNQIVQKYANTDDVRLFDIINKESTNLLRR